MAFEIIDAHQHFWDPVANYHPWLRDERPIVFRYGDYRSLRRRYLAPDYLRETANFTVAGTVYVETELATWRTAPETQYPASF